MNPPKPGAESATRPMYWSVRRELWENRSIYIAPLAAGLVILLGFSITLIGLPRNIFKLATADPVHQRAELVMPYGHVAMLLSLTAFIVGVFYCLDGLHGERRDRSILFWKSLPVSDLTTVLSKATIPLVVLPLLVFAIVFTVQLAMLLLSIIVLQLSGVGSAMLLQQVPFFQMELVFLYCLTVMALWHAPIYGWLLLVSGWARRATFLWAFFPLIAICVFEKIAFNTTHFAALLGYRLIGMFVEAIRVPADPHFIPMAQLTPGKFLTAPGLWIGLVFAVLFLVAAARLRRYRGPI